MRDINISYIRNFVTLIEYNNFTTAAYHLHISQPALSKSIASLEDFLGINLLKRFPKGFELTDAGRYFYESSLYFLKLYEEFLYDISSRVNSNYSGKVRMSIPGAVMDKFFPDIINLLLKQYPSIKVYMKEEDSQSTIQSLLSRKTDFGLAVYPFPEEIKEKYIIHNLVQSLFHIVLPVTHPLAEKKHININELNNISVLTPGEYSMIHQSFDDLCRKNSVYPNYTCLCSQISSLLSLTKAGTGLTVLPQIFLHDLPEGLIHHPLQPALSWKLALITPTNAQPLAVSTTISFIKQYFISYNK